jgi:hypothetical protein
VTALGDPTNPASAERPPGLWPSPWPAEDGGPRREQAPRGAPGLGIRPGEQLRTAAVRDALATTMVVLREPGEVFALRHTLGRRPQRDPSDAWLERIDPRTLEPLARSPRLPGGPFWPGGVAAHANGSLYVVYGRFCHRISPDLELLASQELPSPRPHNSFVVLADGALAIKDLDRDVRHPARLSVLDPATLASRASIELPEPAVGRLSADGNTIYVVGVTTAMRYLWDGERLARDADWEFRYHGGERHSYGWDPVIAADQLWLLDNGSHDYATTMRGAGIASGPVRLIRISLSSSQDHEAVEVCGAARGTVTDPPLVDATRRIAVAYDSGNAVVQAFRFGTTLEPLWRRELAHAAHMIQFPDTGELVMHDFKGPTLAATRIGRAVAHHSAGLVRSRALRKLASRNSGDDVVVLDIETGLERARARVPSMFQSVLFPAPGFERDLYWCTFSTIARLEVA